MLIIHPSKTNKKSRFFRIGSLQKSCSYYYQRFLKSLSRPPPPPP
ncbi:hypothetical protein DR864_05840 [Runella rosea]|uniref:Uncharacterized protein n=1 Tax=Runella rosea TaxID=2259595 RepID=A0A344TF66_9BACT|nr:hypothetical protein DR864_05840 [Runella rosea]